MKKGKESKKLVPDKKIGRPIKEVVPTLSTFQSKPPRDMIPILNNQPISNQYITDIKPFEIFPEWPGNEAAMVSE